MTTTLYAPTVKTAKAKRDPVSERLEAVSATNEADVVVEAEKPDYVKIFLSSIFAVSALFLFGVGVPISIALDDWMGGMGLGAMCAFWGGPSFGVMTGFARLSAWQEAHDADH